MQHYLKKKKPCAHSVPFSRKIWCFLPISCREFHNQASTLKLLKTENCKNTHTLVLVSSMVFLFPLNPKRDYVEKIQCWYCLCKLEFTIGVLPKIFDLGSPCFQLDKWLFNKSLCTGGRGGEPVVRLEKRGAFFIDLRPKRRGRIHFGLKDGFDR